MRCHVALVKMMTPESMRKFEQRRQSDTESVVEFQQALRSLYRLAWPNATVEQKEVALKTRFEEGLINQEMQQYLRLHAMGDTFANTAQKARRFAATIDVPKSRKFVRISTPPSHEVVQLIQEDTSLNKRMENIEKMIKSLQVTAQENKNAQSACNSVSEKPRRQLQPSRNTGVVQNKNLSGQNNGRRQFVQPFNANIKQPRQTVETDTNLQSGRFDSFARGPQHQNLVRAENSGGTYSQSPLGLPPGLCWICQRPGSHSRFHEAPTPPPRARTPDFCWTCGRQGCRRWYHLVPPRTTPPVPPLLPNSGNEIGTRPTGNRIPNYSARNA